jgi:hypothetical protein
MKWLALFAAASSLIAAEPVPEEKPFPKIQNGRSYNVVTFADFLYWRYESPNLVYGRTGVGVRGPVETPVDEDGTSFLPTFDYDPGFRVGLGVKFGASKAFDLVGVYSWLHSHPKGSVSGDPIANFLPNNWLNSATFATNAYSFAGLNLNAAFHSFEVQSGYSFPINPYFALRPYFAMTGFVIEGDLRVRYDFTTPAGAGSIFEIAKSHGTCDSWSIGPKAGIDFVYHMTQNWGIYSNFNITQQIAHIELETVQTIEQPANGVNFAIQRGSLTENRNIGLFGLEIGPTFDAWFDDYRYHVYLRATYGASNLNNGAHLTFLNFNNIDVAEQGDFRGLNVRALLEF